MKQFKYILTIALFLGLAMACSSTDQKQEDTSSKVPVNPIAKETTSEPISKGKTEEEVKNRKAEAEVDKIAREQEARKAKEMAEKVTADLKAKQKKELEEKKAKGISDLEVKKLQEKQAKELANLKAKELEEQKAKAEADKIAQAKAAREIQQEKDRLAIEAQEKEQAKKEAEKLAAANKEQKTEEKPKEQITASAKSIIEKVDKNMVAKTQISTSEMVIHGKRNSRTVVSKGYSEGSTKSFSEYLAPAREKGTKMLKLEDRLWIYSPSTDRTIQLSGHMLRQSIMGSDLSYEDMMEDRKLLDLYNAKVISTENIDGRKTWKIELIAKVEDVSYYKRMIWVDQEKYVPLKEELYAKSGQLLKMATFANVVKVQGRWFPKKMNYKDMLKKGDGTDFIVKEIKFDETIPEHIFSKGSLKK